jgi:hypothetical protein
MRQRCRYGRITPGKLIKRLPQSFACDAAQFVSPLMP